MDKQDGLVFLSEESEGVIFSNHGICNPEKDEVYKLHRNNLFPELKLSRTKLAEEIRALKKNLIKAGHSELIEKERCDLAICHWIADMKIDELVLVRTPQQQVFLCSIKSYICERCFSGLGSFFRNVYVHKEITEHIVDTDLWHRTIGNKTIERNAKPDIRDMDLELCKKHDIAYTQHQRSSFPLKTNKNDPDLLLKTASKTALDSITSRAVLQ